MINKILFYLILFCAEISIGLSQNINIENIFKEYRDDIEERFDILKKNNVYLLYINQDSLSNRLQYSFYFFSNRYSNDNMAKFEYISYYDNEIILINFEKKELRKDLKDLKDLRIKKIRKKDTETYLNKLCNNEWVHNGFTPSILVYSYKNKVYIDNYAHGTSPTSNFFYNQNIKEEEYILEQWEIDLIKEHEELKKNNP